MLKKIDEMVKFRLDDSKIDKYVPTLIKPRLKKIYSVYRLFYGSIDMQVYNEYKRQYQEQCDWWTCNKSVNTWRVAYSVSQYVEEDELTGILKESEMLDELNLTHDSYRTNRRELLSKSLKAHIAHLLRNHIRNNEEL